jgi:hypothetical protein
MSRAYSPTEIIKKKYKRIEWGEDWSDAFDTPEASGVWFIWGNSGNGKSSFIMQLIKELAKSQKVFFNSNEEGTKLTMQKHLIRNDIASVKRNVLIASEPIGEMMERLAKRKCAKVIILDSVQGSRMNIASYHKLIEANPDKLFIFISQAVGKQPKGKTADDIKYYADLKIWVEGYKAISQGRYNPGGEYVIWEEGASRYWGNNI